MITPRAVVFDMAPLWVKILHFGFRTTKEHFGRTKLVYFRMLFHWISPIGFVISHKPPESMEPFGIFWWIVFLRKNSFFVV